MIICRLEKRKDGSNLSKRHRQRNDVSSDSESDYHEQKKRNVASTSEDFMTAFIQPLKELLQKNLREVRLIFGPEGQKEITINEEPSKAQSTKIPMISESPSNSWVPPQSGNKNKTASINSKQVVPSLNQKPPFKTKMDIEQPKRIEPPQQSKFKELLMKEKNERIGVTNKTKEESSFEDSSSEDEKFTKKPSKDIPVEQSSKERKDSQLVIKAPNPDLKILVIP